MKQIKFRAWDNENGVFILPENLVYRLDGHLFDRELDIELHNVELMQFTGLLDKNGKEIYESDVVKHEFEGEYGPYEHRDTVEYHEGAFYPVCEKPGSEFEVIGNIYSNPELL